MKERWENTDKQRHDQKQDFNPFMPNKIPHTYQMGQSQSNQASIQCWAIIGPPAKRSMMACFSGTCSLNLSTQHKKRCQSGVVSTRSAHVL